MIFPQHKRNGAKSPRGVVFSRSGHSPDTHKSILYRGPLALEPTMSSLNTIYEKSFEKQKSGDWGSLRHSPAGDGDETLSDAKRGRAKAIFNMKKNSGSSNNDYDSNNNNVAGVSAMDCSVNSPWGDKTIDETIPRGENQEGGGRQKNK